MKLKGARIFLECLLQEGVETLFGYPGGAVIDIYHEMPDYPFKHVLVRHEQGAVHAADGYARATGQVGVALATSGPGATNTITGIAAAYMDSIPVVVFTGQVPTQLIGNDAFQEVDMVGISRPCSKHNYLVSSVESLPRIIKEAFYLARTGRPGPVVVDLPKDVMNAYTEFYYPKHVRLRSYNPHTEPNAKQIKKAVDLISRAERPLIFGGGGVVSAEAHQEMTQLARELGVPVTTSMMGLGTFPGDDPLWLGMLGMHGTYVANMAVNNCDLMLAVGVRFDDRVTGKLDTFAPYAKIVHIDIDPTSIRKNVAVEIPLVSDCKLALQAILEELGERREAGESLPAWDLWWNKLQEWDAAQPLRYEASEETIKPQQVVEKLDELTRGKAIITTEVGQNQMWAAQFYRFLHPRSWLSSGGLGVMGYGLPAAIGAQAAFPEKLVIDIAGDGSIQMNIQELATAVCYNLPVKVVILNNTYLGMVRQWQDLFYSKNYCSTCLEYSPDFVRLAEAFGARGFRVSKPQELDATLREALSAPGPVIVDVPVAKEENVYPMVPAGAPLNEMLLV